MKKILFLMMFSILFISLASAVNVVFTANSSVGGGQGTNVTFSNINIGTADASRYILLGATGRVGGNDNITNAYINSIGMTLINKRMVADNTLGFWLYHLPTGTTANFTINFAVEQARQGIAVWAIYDLNSTPYDFSITGTGSTLIDFPNNSGVVGLAYDQTGAMTWTNITEKFDSVTGDADRFTGASDNFTTGQTDMNVTAIGSELLGVVSFSTNTSASSPNISISLISPVDVSTFITTETQLVNFTSNASATDISISNVSLYIDGVLNQTNTSGINGTYVFSTTLQAKNYNWTIKAVGSDGITYNASNGTFSFFVVKSKLIYPSNNSVIASGTEPTFQINFTHVGLGGFPVTLDVRYSNNNTQLASLSNNTINSSNMMSFPLTFNIPIGSYRFSTSLELVNGTIIQTNEVFFFNASDFKPELIQNFTNITLGYNEGTFEFSPLYDYWNSSGDFTNATFSFYNPDTLQQYNLTTPMNFGGANGNSVWNYIMFSKMSIQAKGIFLSNTYKPFLFGVISFEENYTLQVNTSACNEYGCTSGNIFYIIIGDNEEATTEGDGFIVSLANYASRVLPEAEGLSFKSQMVLVVVILLALNILAIIGAYKFGADILLVLGIINVLGLAYFVAIDYVPMGMIYLFLIIIGAFYLIKNR